MDLCQSGSLALFLAPALMPVIVHTVRHISQYKRRRLAIKSVSLLIHCSRRDLTVVAQIPSSIEEWRLRASFQEEHELWRDLNVLVRDQGLVQWPCTLDWNYQFTPKDEPLSINGYAYTSRAQTMTMIPNTDLTAWSFSVRGLKLLCPSPVATDRA